MARDVRLNKEVFDKRTYQKTIDTTFKELGVKTIQEQIDEQPTVQEFFDMYTELFYQINERGPDNSHEYLVKTSGEYISFEDKDELVEALQKEIATLRKELLQTQQDLADSLGDLAEASQPLPEIEEVEAPIENPVVDIVNTPEPTQDTPSPTTTDPYPNQNDVAVEWFNNELQEMGGAGNGYKVRPISYNMILANFNTIDREVGRFEKYDETKATIEEKLSKVFTNTLSPELMAGIDDDRPFRSYPGSDIGENYRYMQWTYLRNAIFKLSPSNNVKKNLYTIVSETTTAMGKHYKKERNFKEEGGLL